MTRLRIAAAALVVVATGLSMYAVLVGWQQKSDVLFVAVAVVGYVWIIVTDSSLRGRSGGGWLLACVLVAPIGLTLFLLVAVRDRIRGRRGIEAFWPPGARWCFLAAIGMAVTAVVLAFGQISVARPNLGTIPGFSGVITGSCDNNALSLSLGNAPPITEMLSAPAPYPPSGTSPSAAGGPPSSLQVALDRFAQRCTAKAGRRMVASEVSIAGRFGWR